MEIAAPSQDQDLAALDGVWGERASSHVASDAVYETLRAVIVQGLLRPGLRLSEGAVARRLSLSRTPVREALLRLESERLVERGPRGGLVVGEVTADEILEVYAVRVGLDGLIASLAADNATPADLVRMRALNERLRQVGQDGDAARTAEINLRFHEELCRTTRNELLLYLLGQVHDRVRRFPGTTFSVPGRTVSAPNEHDELLEAIEARDRVRAQDLAERHMRHAMALRIEMLDDERRTRP
jgi:DNA-binding GntR family transcriptional regulator